MVFDFVRSLGPDIGGDWRIIDAQGFDMMSSYGRCGEPVNFLGVLLGLDLRMQMVRWFCKRPSPHLLFVGESMR